MPSQDQNIPEKKSDRKKRKSLFMSDVFWNFNGVKEAFYLSLVVKTKLMLIGIAPGLTE